MVVLEGDVYMIYSILKTFIAPSIGTWWIKGVHGLWHIDKNSGAVLAANHMSFLDPLLIGAVMPARVYFVTGERIFDARFLNIVMRLTGQIRVDRSGGDNREALERCVKLLKHNKLVCIFPEGSRAKRRMLRKPYHGAARLALFAKAPIIPIGIVGAFELGSVYNVYPRMSQEVVIRIGRPMSFQKYYEKKDDKTAHEEIMELVMKEIYDLCEKRYPLYFEENLPLTTRNIEALDDKKRRGKPRVGFGAHVLYI